MSLYYVCNVSVIVDTSLILLSMSCMINLSCIFTIKSSTDNNYILLQLFSLHFIMQ